MTEANVHEESCSFSDIDRRHCREIFQNIKNYGCYTSLAFLDSCSEIFSIPNAEGFIGFRSTSKFAIVLGDPVCPTSQIAALIEAFQNQCAKNHKKIVYAAVTQSFASWLLTNGYTTAIEVAEELFLNPQDDISKGAKSRNMRRMITLAQKANVSIHEYTGYEMQVEAAMENISENWLKGRTGPQICLGHIDLFTNRIGKRWFYAKQNDEIIGVLLLNKLASGWVFNVSMLAPKAPPGTSESMMAKVLQTLQKEGSHSLSLGIFAKKEVGNMMGLGRFSTCMVKFVYKFLIRIFKLEKRKFYWKKFHPTSNPCYLIPQYKGLGIAYIIDLLRSLNTSL